MNLTAVFFLTHQPPLAHFYEVSRKIYGDESQPDEINQRYLITCLMIYKDDEPAGRLCLYSNAATGNNKILLFGNLESVHNELVFIKLMTTAESYGQQHGYEMLLGPINGSTWDEYRLPLTNEGRQFITDLPQPLYYADYLLQGGYGIIHRYFTHHSILAHQAMDATLEETFQRQGVFIRSINLNDYDSELRRLYPFCINAFSKNIYYSTIDEAGFVEKLRKMQPFLQPDFVLIAENDEQQIVAFLLCFPDVYQKDAIIMKTMARSSKPHLRGLMTHMINLFYNRAVDAGYTKLLHAFFHEDNRSAILSGKYEGKPFKKYALFQKNLNS